MVYTYKEIFNKYKDDYKIRKALENKEIYKIEKGIYSDSKYANPLIVYSIKYPNAVITMDNAFYFYNLTDVIPNKIYLDTPRNSHPIKNNKIVQLFSDEDLLNIGKNVVNVENQEIYMFDKERMLIELIRKRNKIPFDYYKEIISNYRDIADELDMYKIENYLSYFKNDVNLFDTMQREVF
ncbi:MAG TPA: hypothetical protein DCZ30_06955 [Clostridiales bacterium]|nr:hypothetical protein [Clostridiales bacterium]